jgi:acetyl-CoA acetyltransferase
VSFRGKAAIIGIGELPTQRTTPGRSVAGLMGEAARLAVQDAHIRKEDVDGIVTEGGNTYPAFVAEYLGLRVRFATGSSMMGASGATGVTLASMAVMNGLANYVLVVIAQARNPALPAAPEGFPGGASEFDFPYGPAAGANTGYAQIYKRHMEKYGTTQEQLAHVAANERFNALENPNSAFKGQPITVEDVIASRYVNYPLRLLECVMPCGGAAAVIVTTAERAKASLTRPVYVLGGGVALDDFAGMQRPDITVTPVARSAPIALAMSGYTPRDIQFAEFYDCYTILHAACLEDAGLVPKGEIGPFFASTDTTYKGSFPINTDGGQLSGGQPGLAGGFRHVVEGARQIMGKAGPRQVARNDLCMVNG